MKQALFLLLAGTALLAQNHPTVEFDTQAGQLKLTAIRHASLFVEAGGKVVHIDPVGAGYDALPKADLILITHTHGDHLDLKTLGLLRKDSTVVITPAAAAQKVEGAKVLGNGESTTAGAWTIEAVPAYNLQRGPRPGSLYHEKGAGNGYVLAYGGFRLYIAGDTEGVPEMQNLKNINVALIPMNLPYTMTPDEAAAAVKAFKPKTVIPYHFRGTDLAVFEKALAGSGVEVKILDWYQSR